MSESPDARPQSSSGISTTSSGINKRKKKKNVVPLSLEEIFNQLSTATSANINPPPGRIVLTPRSAEVCLKLGLNPEVLKIRDIDSFWEPGIDPAVQRIRHEVYVQRRYDTMKQARLERKRMAVAEFESSTNFNAVETMTPEMILEQQRQQTSTLIQQEMARIEKMQKRQQKELEQMIEYEVTRAKVAQEMEKRIQEAKKKDERRKKQQEKRMKLMAEERRLRELQKVAMEEAEEANRVALAKAMHDKEKQLQEENERKAAEAKRAAREAEIEKKRKHEEHRRQVEQFFAEEQMELRKRLESMQFADKKKQDAIMERQRKLSEEQAKKRAAIEQRIQQNMEMAKLIEEKKVTDFLTKQAHHEELREENLRRQEHERLLKAQELELQEHRRRMILLQQKKEEEKKAEELLVKFEEEEMHVHEVQQLRQKELEVLNERKNLRTQMKLENVQRVQRINEYKRMGTLKKIDETDDRIKKMVEQKRALLFERRKAAIATKLKKESIAKVMEEVRTNASMANKIITQALTGKITLDSLASTTGSHTSNGNKKRSKSADRLRKKMNRTEGDALGLGRNVRSAGGEYESSDEQPNLAKYSGVGDSPAKPYISPYDSVPAVTN